MKRSSPWAHRCHTVRKVIRGFSRDAPESLIWGNYLAQEVGREVLVNAQIPSLLLDEARESGSGLIYTCQLYRSGVFQPR